MQAEPDNDQEGEERVERKRNRKAWGTEGVGNRGPGGAPSRGLAFECYDTHRCINDVGPGCCYQYVWARIRTERAEIDKAGEGENPEPLTVDYVAAIELEGEPTLDISASERSTKQGTNQKAIS